MHTSFSAPSIAPPMLNNGMINLTRYAVVPTEKREQYAIQSMHVWQEMEMLCQTHSS